MLTAKGKYCLKALACLASLAPGEPMQARKIAEQNRIPKKFLDAILGDLRHADLVLSKRGPGGGYTLARAPSEIGIGYVIRVIDGPLAPLACASQTAFRPCRDCTEIKTCAIRLVMTRVREAMSDVLDHTSVADLVVGLAADRKLSRQSKTPKR